MEHRNAQHHYDRLGETLREEISAMIEGELTDPRIGLATVTDVRMSPDGKSAHVSINVAGDDQEAEQTLEGLEAARNYIRLFVQSAHTSDCVLLCSSRFTQIDVSLGSKSHSNPSW